MEYRQRERELNAGAAIAHLGQGLCGSVLTLDAGDLRGRLATAILDSLQSRYLALTFF